MLHQPQPVRPASFQAFAPPPTLNLPPLSDSLPASLRIACPRPSNLTTTTTTSNTSLRPYRNRASYVPARTLTQRVARNRESMPPLPAGGGYVAFRPGASLPAPVAAVEVSEDEQRELLEQQEEVLRDVEALLAVAERPKSAFGMGFQRVPTVVEPRCPSAPLEDDRPMSPALFAKIRRALSFRVDEAENEEDEGYTDEFDVVVSSELMAGKYQSLIGSLS